MHDYPKISKNTFLNLQNDEICSYIATAMFEFFKNKYGKSWFQDEYSLITQLPEAWQYFYTSYFLEFGISTGGFLPYFWNTSGKFAETAKQAYQAFGLGKYADIVDEAISEFTTAQKLYQEKRLEDTSFDAESFFDIYDNTNFLNLDNKWYADPETEAICNRHRVEYIKNNLDSFCQE